MLSRALKVIEFADAVQTGKMLEELFREERRADKMVKAGKMTLVEAHTYKHQLRKELLAKYNECVLGEFIKPAQSNAGICVA